ncbi:MAG: DUF815 domain-containing protein [Geminicoccaceae bacterium]
MQPGDLPRHGRALRPAFRPADRGRALRREALEWAKTRGSRSGRVAWQLIQDVAGRLGAALDMPAGRS